MSMPVTQGQGQPQALADALVLYGTTLTWYK